VPALPMISVIDDDASVCASTDNLLRSLGYSVFTFGSAEDFLRSNCVDDASCVIADVNMPVIDGVELLVRLRAQGKQVPFIFITAFPDQAVSRRASRAGAVCLLAKPFDQHDLIQSLEQALQGRDDAGADR
jgi:FixJ family two-component response regulator